MESTQKKGNLKKRVGKKSALMIRDSNDKGDEKREKFGAFRPDKGAW